MRRQVFIQFRFPWNETRAFLPRDLGQQISEFVSEGERYSSVELEGGGELAGAIRRHSNVVVGGRSLIRLIREGIRLDREDIREEDFYVLDPAAEWEDELTLRDEPAQYYHQNVESRCCGRYIWIQTRDLELGLGAQLRSDLDGVESGEIVVSGRLRRALERRKLEGVIFREVAGSADTWQLSCMGKAVVSRSSEFIVERDICSICGKPRIVSLEDSNGVSMFKPPYDQPRIERTPTLEIVRSGGDFSRTDREFGTLGRVPEKGAGLGPEDFSHRVSGWLWVASGKLCRLLYEEKVNGFGIAPAKMVEGHTEAAESCPSGRDA